jgi:hypothetical protein
MGVIQAAAVVVAALIYGMTGPQSAKILASLGLTYLALCLSAATAVLMPRQRYVLSAEDVRGELRQGLVEMGQATELMASISQATSNWVTASLLDLGRASLLAVIAAMLTAFR